MLRVTSIIEGGINLESGQPIPRSMVVSNGKLSVTVPVPESVVKDLVNLFANEMGMSMDPVSLPPLSEKTVMNNQ